jgi:ATP-dependent Lon protease
MKPSPKILIVDDIGDWRATMRGLLRDENFDAQVAGSAEEALAKLEAETFDLAVLDMRLDERDEANSAGLELAQQIRQRWPQTKAIIITGYDTLAATRIALEPDEQGDRLVEVFASKTDTDRLVQFVREVLSTN